MDKKGKDDWHMGPPSMAGDLIAERNKLRKQLAGEREKRIGAEEFAKWALMSAAKSKNESNQLRARLEEMINIFNAAGISMDKLPPEKLLNLGGKKEKLK